MAPKSHCSLLAYVNIWKELLLICLRDKAIIALFSKLSNFYFDLRPPGAKQRSENPTPGATRMCESPGVARGRETSLINFKEISMTIRTGTTCLSEATGLQKFCLSIVFVFFCKSAYKNNGKTPWKTQPGFNDSHL